MSGKYDALIQKAQEWTDSRKGHRDPYQVLGEAEDFVDDLLTALREAQAHVPPEGWRVTEWTREDGARAVPRGDGKWHALDRNDFKVTSGMLYAFPTAAAAMAAIEEARREDHG